MEVSKVLLVDDDPNIRKLARMSLELVGHWRVTAASSGKEALDLLSVELPDLILLDVMMPGLDGRMTLTQLKSIPAFNHLPVILMTAKVHNEDLDEFIQLGAKGIIIKPFDPMLLPQQLIALLDSK